MTSPLTIANIQRSLINFLLGVEPFTNSPVVPGLFIWVPPNPDSPPPTPPAIPLLIPGSPPIESPENPYPLWMEVKFMGVLRSPIVQGITKVHHMVHISCVALKPQAQAGNTDFLDFMAYESQLAGPLREALATNPFSFYDWSQTPPVYGGKIIAISRPDLYMDLDELEAFSSGRQQALKGFHKLQTTWTLIFGS